MAGAEELEARYGAPAKIAHESLGMGPPTYLDDMITCRQTPRRAACNQGLSQSVGNKPKYQKGKIVVACTLPMIIIGKLTAAPTADILTIR